jgi:uncharacterized membrane protein YfcA
MNTTIVSIILGVVAGIIAGGLGQSGAELIVPSLLLLDIVPNFKTAAGTVLLTILPPIYLLAIFDYYKRKQVNTYVAVILIVSFFFSTSIGSYLTKDLTDKTLEYLVSFYFLLISILFFCIAIFRNKK